MPRTKQISAKHDDNDKNHENDNSNDNDDHMAEDKLGNLSSKIVAEYMALHFVIVFNIAYDISWYLKVETND